MSVHVAPVTSSTIVVAVDVGKTSAMLSVTDATRHRLVGPSEFAMTGSALAEAIAAAAAALPSMAQVKVGVEAAGHYHRPVLDHRWPDGWEVLELNPAQVAEQRRVQGRRRVKTDVIDLEAITELVLAGYGCPVADRDVVIGEVTAWGRAPESTSRHADCDEEPVARTAGPRVSRADFGSARCVGDPDRPASSR